jgi:hypothetical protein
MFVESGDRFDPARAVMYLVADAPQKMAVMTGAMPPIKDEGPDKPADQSFEPGRSESHEVEDRMALEPIPRDSRQHHNAELASVKIHYRLIASECLEDLAATLEIQEPRPAGSHPHARHGKKP